MIADKELDFVEQNDAPEDATEFDQALLEELNEDLGPETFLFLLRQCVEDVSVRLGKLLALPSAAADPAATRALTHQLKGLFLQFGANTAMRDAAELEAATPDDAEAKLERLRRSGARALAHFQQLRGPI